MKVTPGGASGDRPPPAWPAPCVGAWFALRGVLVVLALALVWWPEWAHFQIDRSSVSDAELAASMAVPDDAQLVAVARIDLSELDRSLFRPLHFARSLRDGWIDLPGPRGTRLRSGGHPADFQVGPPSYRLQIAGLAIEGVLLQAYEESNDREWLEMALQRTLEFSRHELRTRHDRGFLWNDHAVAARAAVLIALWRHVRADARLAQAHGHELLSFAARNGRWLAEPGHFTVRTNHGVMQNLALLQSSAAFPGLAEATAWRTLALDRLRLQLGFYVSAEGVVLEHSAGYQLMGTRLLAHAVALLRLNGMAPDATITAASEFSVAVLSGLLRPDGSLPLIGNTVGGRAVLSGIATASAHDAGDSVFPVAGWAVWWNRSAGQAAAQTSLSWAKHDGHGHKHADEGSLHLWSGGTDWITATGYWPYGAPYLEAAYGWRGSNALHEPGEAAGSVRNAELYAYGTHGTLRFLDMGRTRRDGAAYRRQVLQFGPQDWLVVDFVAASPRGASTLWTLDPRLSVGAAATAGQFGSSAGIDGRRLTLALASSDPSLRTRALRAEVEPFGGWVVQPEGPVPAPAVEVHVPAARSVTATLLQIGRDPVRVDWPRRPDAAADEQMWDLGLQILGRTLRFSRRQSTLTVQESGLDGVALSTRTLELRGPGETSGPARQALRAAYRNAVLRFPPWRDLYDYRAKASAVLLALLLCVEVTLLAWGRLAAPPWRSRWGTAIQAGGVALFVATAAYLPFVYLAP